MLERELSIADRFVQVMNEIQKIDVDVDNDNPYRYPLRRMRHAAEKVLLDALTTASDIAETAWALKSKLESSD